MTRLIAINFRCRHWLAWTALLLPCALAAFGSIPNEPNSTSVLGFQYDAADRLTNQVDANGVMVTNTYDVLNRVLTRSYPDGGIEKFEYSARGLITYTNQLGLVTRFDHDALGRRTAVTNPSNQVLRSTYSPAGDLLIFGDGKNQTNWFGYDLYGRLTSKTNAAGTEMLRFQYDAAGRMTNRWTVAKGNTAYSYGFSCHRSNVRQEKGLRKKAR